MGHCIRGLKRMNSGGLTWRLAVSTNCRLSKALYCGGHRHYTSFSGLLWCPWRLDRECQWRALPVHWHQQNLILQTPTFCSGHCWCRLVHTCLYEEGTAGNARLIYCTAIVLTASETDCNVLKNNMIRYYQGGKIPVLQHCFSLKISNLSSADCKKESASAPLNSIIVTRHHGIKVVSTASRLTCDGLHTV